MKKLVIIFLAFTMHGCVSLSIGNRSIESDENKNTNDSYTVYSQNGKTMVAINYILPQRAGQFEMLTKTVIMSTSSDLKNGDFFKVSAEFETENFRGYQFDNLYEFEFGYRNQLNSDLKLYNELQSRNIIVRNLDIPQKSDYYQVKSYV